MGQRGDRVMKRGKKRRVVPSAVTSPPVGDINQSLCLVEEDIILKS